MIDQATLSTIQKDVEANLKGQQDRLRNAKHNLDFYLHGCERKHLTHDIFDDKHSQRQSWLMREVVCIKTRDLYKQSPSRIVPDKPDVTEWLEQVYKQNGMWAKWPEADRLAMVSDVAWFQVAATGDPEDPIRINLYGSDQVAAWTTPEDPTHPVAVCLIADQPYLDEIRRTFTLWTDTDIYTYVAKATADLASGNMDPPKLQSTEPNPYGVIPFIHVHAEYPTTNLWTASPGSYLAKVNRYINWRLTEIANLIRSNPPMKVVENADASFQPPMPFRPQDFLQVPGQGPGAAKDGKFRYEQANLGFVQQEWEDLQNYIEHTLECVGVPPAAYRQVQTSVKSGAALMAEQISLIEAAKGKQMPFAHYEESLALLCLQVATAYYGDAALSAALRDFSLTIKWPDLWPALPGPERDRADEWDLDNDLTSRIMLLIKRDNMTREEAIQHLEQVAEDKQEEEGILGPEPAPVVVATGDGMSPGDAETDAENTITNEESHD